MYYKHVYLYELEDVYYLNEMVMLKNLFLKGLIKNIY